MKELPSISALIDSFSKLPGVGVKSAERMAYAVLAMGICGLTLCCSTFLNQFDGISISRAKNQMLTLNIPKLSGHCGKLICCLLYEDDLYTEAKKDFPRLGTVIHIDNNDYRVDGFNVLSRSVKLVSMDDLRFVTLDEYNNFAKKSFHPTPSAAPTPTPAPANGAAGK